MKKRYLYFLPAGIAVVLLTGLFYNRPAADTAMPAAAGTEGQGISEEAIETETIAAQSEHETSETENEPIAAEESKTSDIENTEETIESSSREEENESETAAEENSKTTLVYGQKEETPFRAAADSYERVDPDWMEPVSGLEGEEDLERYASEIFYDIVCHPDKIEEYSKILTQRTFDMFGYVQWVYVDPEYVYGMVQTECNELLAEEENYQITYSVIDQEKYRYHYKIYNQNGMVVREEQSDREPIISYIDDNMIEILISAGTDTFFCTYYDISEDRFSEVYQTPIIAEYGKVVYFEIREKVFQIIVRDIFDKNAFYKEFEIPNISFAAMPIKEAIFLNEDTLLIKYLSGELYKEEEIILDLE